ncbi:MAG: hypothetical protein JXR70_01040 [Spirochaetales bacterium]|nr:hypothetical protein [Spirochaetales bacterium]
MLKNKISLGLLALLLSSCFNSGFSAAFQGPVEIFISQGREIPVKNGETIKIIKKGFDIIVRFHKNVPGKKLFVQFSPSEHFFKGLVGKKKIGEILSVVYPDMEKDLLNTAFLSGGMSGAMEPGNPSRLFFTSDYSNILMYYQNESDYSFNSAESKTDFIECRYGIENFFGSEKTQSVSDYPGTELYVSFIVPQEGHFDYDQKSSAAVKIAFVN